MSDSILAMLFIVELVVADQVERLREKLGEKNGRRELSASATPATPPKPPG